MQNFTKEDINNIDPKYYKGNKLVPLIDFRFNGDIFTVCDDGEWFSVERKEHLGEKKLSYQEKKNKEIDKITEKLNSNKDKVVSFLVESAIAEMEKRIKMSIAFGKDGTTDFAIAVLPEVKKMIKEKADREFKI